MILLPDCDVFTQYKYIEANMSCAFEYKCKQHIAMNHVSSASQRSFKLKKFQT